MRLLLFVALVAILISTASCTLSKKDRKAKSKTEKVRCSIFVHHTCESSCVG